MSISPAAKLRIESLAVGDPGRSEARELITQWQERFPGTCPIQAGLIEQALTALVDLGRCRRIRAALLAERARTAELRWQNEEQDRLLRCLQTMNLDPYLGMAEFIRFGTGVRHLVSRWVRIEEAFRRDRCLYGTMMLEAIQMQGCSARVSELFLSEEAYLTWVYCFLAQPAPRQEEGEMLWGADVMPMSIQCNPPQPWPPPREYCQEQIQKLIVRELPRLRALEEKLRLEVEEPARAAAIELALAQTTPEETTLLRAEQRHERSYQAAWKALLKLPAAAPARQAVAEERPIAQVIPPEPPQPGPERRPPAVPRTVTNQSWIAGSRVGETHRPSPSLRNQTLESLQRKITMVVHASDSATEEPPKKVRFVSERKKAASRENGKKGGIKTDAGKLISRSNGATHHMTSTVIDLLLDDAERAEARARTSLLIAQLGAVGDAECTEVRNAVIELIRGRRIRVADIAAVQRAREEVANSYVAVKSATARAAIANLANDPGGSMDVLCGCTYGLNFAIGQLDVFATRLDTHVGLHPSQRRLFVRLAGYRPESWLTEPSLLEFYRACIGAKGKGVSTVAEAVQMLEEERASDIDEVEYERRIAFELPRVPSELEANATLKLCLAELRAEFVELLEPIAERERVDLERAVAEAAAAVTREGALRHRYATAHERAHQAHLRTLKMLQDQRFKREAMGEGPASGAEAVYESAPEPAATVAEGPVGAPEGEFRTEPTVPEVPGCSGGCADVSARPWAPDSAVAESSTTRLEFLAGPAPNPGFGDVVVGAPGVASGSSG